MKTAERLALFDLDGTLIDSSYRVTDERIYEVVQAAQDAGWQIGLSSDTPYEPLAVWRQRFGMNGPIIAEKGAVVETVAGDHSSLFYDLKDTLSFTNARVFIEAVLPQQGIPVWSGNSTEALRAGLTFGEPGETVVVTNNLGRCSLRFFVRTVSSDGKLNIDNTQTQEMVERCREFFPEFEDLSVVIGSGFGIVIVQREKYTKRAGTQKLLGETGLSRCVMIGDSISDYIGSDIADHYAVGNADDDYRSQAKYVVEGDYTLGASEILAQLTRSLSPTQ